MYHDDIVFGREIAKVHRLNKDKNGETIGITVYRSDGAFGVVGYIWTSPTHGDLHPIPITAEVLEKNGFESTTKPNVFTLTHGELQLYVSKELDGWYMSFVNFMERLCILQVIRQNSIHELQHALRLAGVDKEINL